MEVTGWEELYQQALIELDDGQLPIRISEAESAIRVRMAQAQEIAKPGSDHEELHKLQDALYSLTYLKLISSRPQKCRDIPGHRRMLPR